MEILNIPNILYSYLSEGYSWLTMALAACSSITLAAAIAIGVHLGRRNHTLVALLIWFLLMAAAAVSASGLDQVASLFVAKLIWKIILMGLIAYVAFWLGRSYIARAARRAIRSAR